MMATYRPHNSELMEWVQTRGRMRSNKSMIDRRNLKGLVSELKKGEAVWFAPIRITAVKAAPLRHFSLSRMRQPPTALMSYPAFPGLQC
jgi:KDO2-lipid IV(A) palmitoleoyltransferase